MKAILVAKPQVDVRAIGQWLEDRGDSWPGGDIPEEPWIDLDNSAVKNGQGSLLCEFGGRLCYDSFSDRGKPDNQRYLKHIIDVGHGSVLEHANYSFLIDGVTRALTHELIRHRAGFAYSQLSTRFADPETAKMKMVVPPALSLIDDEDLRDQVLDCFACIHDESLGTYEEVANGLTDFLKDKYKGTALRKVVRQTARYALTHLVETRLLVTGNVRAWRHVLSMRGSVHADTEIRLLAVEIARQLKEVEPNMFFDVNIHEQGDDGLPWVELQNAKV